MHEITSTITKRGMERSSIHYNYSNRTRTLRSINKIFQKRKVELRYEMISIGRINRPEHLPATQGFHMWEA